MAGWSWRVLERRRLAASKVWVITPVESRLPLASKENACTVRPFLKGLGSNDSCIAHASVTHRERARANRQRRSIRKLQSKTVRAKLAKNRVPPDEALYITGSEYRAIHLGRTQDAVVRCGCSV